MSDIKFACPACGQRVKCDHTHAGHSIPCPGCHTHLIIPEVDPATFSEEKLPQASLAQPSPAPAPPAKEQETVILKPEPKPKPAPAPAAPTPAEAEPPPAPPVERCLCPVCHSELQVPPPPKRPTGTLPVAKLLRPGSTQGAAAPGVAAEEEAKQIRWSSYRGEETTKSDTAQPAAPAPSPAFLKPRLNYILTGKPPAPPPRPDGAPRRKKGTSQADTPPPPPAPDADQTEGGKE